MRVCLLSGGTGGARLAAGLAACLAPGELTVVANTGDDFERHGLLISPDQDSIFYALAGLLDWQRAWGIAGDSFTAFEQLGRLADESWFQLGDRDLALHVWRSHLLRSGGVGLTQIAVVLADRLGISSTVLPMSDERCPTLVRTRCGWLGFQEWFVRDRCQPPALQVSLCPHRRASAQVLAALAKADLVVIGPSNPAISIEPILALEGVVEALLPRRRSVLAVSPMIGGVALKGPTVTMMVSMGRRADLLGICEVYREVAATLMIDPRDLAMAEGVRRAGLEPACRPILMGSPDAAIEVAEGLLEWAIGVI